MQVARTLQQRAECECDARIQLTSQLGIAIANLPNNEFTVYLSNFQHRIVHTFAHCTVHIIDQLCFYFAEKIISLHLHLYRKKFHSTNSVFLEF